MILISKATQDQIQKEPPQEILECQGVFLEDFKVHLPPVGDKSHTTDLVLRSLSSDLPHVKFAFYFWKTLWHLS